MQFFKDLRGRSKLAFDGVLNCPICAQNEQYDPKNQKWRYDRHVTPHLIRYICKKCGMPVRYDVSAQLTGRDLGYIKKHPYANIAQGGLIVPR